MLDLLGLLSKSAPNVHAFTSLDQNPLVYKVKLWHTEALKTADFLKIRIAAHDVKHAFQRSYSRIRQQVDKRVV